MDNNNDDDDDDTVAVDAFRTAVGNFESSETKNVLRHSGLRRISEFKLNRLLAVLSDDDDDAPKSIVGILRRKLPRALVRRTRVVYYLPVKLRRAVRVLRLLDESDPEKRAELFLGYCRINNYAYSTVVKYYRMLRNTGVFDAVEDDNDDDDDDDENEKVEFRLTNRPNVSSKKDGISSSRLLQQEVRLLSPLPDDEPVIKRRRRRRQKGSGGGGGEGNDDDDDDETIIDPTYENNIRLLFTKPPWVDVQPDRRAFEGSVHTRIVSKDDFKKLFNHLLDNFSRYTAPVLLAFYTGLRTMEILQFSTYTLYQLENNYPETDIKRKKTMTRENDSVNWKPVYSSHLTQFVQLLIVLYADEYKMAKLNSTIVKLFMITPQTLVARMKISYFRACKKKPPLGFGIHSCRYHLATLMAEESKNTVLVQKLLQHSRSKTTSVYLKRHLNESREIFDRLTRSEYAETIRNIEPPPLLTGSPPPPPPPSGIRFTNESPPSPVSSSSSSSL